MAGLEMSVGNGFHNVPITVTWEQVEDMRRRGFTIGSHTCSHPHLTGCDDATLDRLEGEGLVAFRYTDENGTVTEAANRNGSARNIAGILSPNLRICGLMPHPEDLVDPLMGGTDGLPMFESLAENLVSA